MLILNGKFEKVEQLTTKKKLIFSTAEILPEIEFHQSINSEGYLLFNPDQFRAKVIEIIQGRKIGIDNLGRTPSEKLRKTLFLVADQKGIQDFEDFYRSEMERICSHYQYKYL